MPRVCQQTIGILLVPRLEARQNLLASPSRHVSAVKLPPERVLGIYPRMTTHLLGNPVSMWSPATLINSSFHKRSEVSRLAVQADPKPSMGTGSNVIRIPTRGHPYHSTQGLFIRSSHYFHLPKHKLYAGLAKDIDYHRKHVLLFFSTGLHVPCTSANGGPANFVFFPLNLTNFPLDFKWSFSSPPRFSFWLPTSPCPLPSPPVASRRPDNVEAAAAAGRGGGAAPPPRGAAVRGSGGAEAPAARAATPASREKRKSFGRRWSRGPNNGGLKVCIGLAVFVYLRIVRLDLGF